MRKNAYGKGRIKMGRDETISLLACAADDPALQEKVNEIFHRYEHSKHGDPEEYLLKEFAKIKKSTFGMKKKNPKTRPAPGKWYVLYSPTGSVYHAYKKKVPGGWDWTEWLTFAKPLSYTGAKRVFNEMRKRMSSRPGSILMVACSEEAKRFLL